MRKKIGLRLARDSRGATAAIFAIAMPLLVGMGALAVDVGIWNVQKRQAQGAADQAAYSAAVAAKANGDDKGDPEGKAVAANMGFVHNVNGVTVEVHNPPTSGQFATEAGYWEVIIREPQATWLAGYFLGGGPTVAARAVAGGANGGNACIIGLNQTADETVKVWGNGTISTKKCNVYTNSSSDKSLVCGGSCVVNASTYAVGGNKEQGNGDLAGAVNATGRSPVEDPYKDVTASAPGACAATNLTPANNATINPGHYCGTLTISNSVTLSPGVYYVDKLSVSGTLKGPSGVTIILTSNETDVFATNGSPTINMEAPKSGTYAGIAIMNLTTPKNKNALLKFNGDTEFSVLGALYFPKWSMEFLGSFDDTKCTQLVADKITITGDANMLHVCPGSGIRSPGGTTIALLE